VLPLAVLSTVLGGCTSPPERTAPPPITQTGTAPPTPAPESTGPVAPTGEYTTLVTRLDVPWSIVRLDDDRALLSLRDTGDIVLASRDGSVTPVGTVEGVVAGGEGGLLGLTLLRDDEDWLYAYYTSANDNRVVRYRLTGTSGTPALGERETVLAGLPKAGNHNGGRIAFGPDGMLYVTAGDAGGRAAAQDPSALAGKILRITRDGDIPADNPFPGSPVYSLGHRNPQGIAWTRDGRLWASEFGQNSWDELNIIEPGRNYGWPAVEGIAGDASFTDPVFQWTTAEASPSGLTVVDDTLFLAALRGQALWGILDGVTVPEGSRGLDGVVSATGYFTGEFGRVRDVAPGPDGTLWLITNNTDGRGSPSVDDDRLIEVRLAPMQEG